MVGFRFFVHISLELMPFWCQDYNNSTVEDLKASVGNPMLTYTIAKTLAEREVWKFADEHPEIDITTSESMSKV